MSINVLSKYHGTELCWILSASVHFGMTVVLQEKQLDPPDQFGSLPRNKNISSKLAFLSSVSLLMIFINGGMKAKVIQKVDKDSPARMTFQS